MNNKGFTLIEFVVIVAIIGILSAVIAPNIFSKQQADENELKNQRLIVDKALTLCFSLEGSFPPSSYTWTDTTETPPVIKTGDWIDYLIMRNYLPASIDINKSNYRNYNQATGTYIR